MCKKTSTRYVFRLYRRAVMANLIFSCTGSYQSMGQGPQAEGSWTLSASKHNRGHGSVFPGPLYSSVRMEQRTSASLLCWCTAGDYGQVPSPVREALLCLRSEARMNMFAPILDAGFNLRRGWHKLCAAVQSWALDALYQFVQSYSFRKSLLHRIAGLYASIFSRPSTLLENWQPG